MSLSTSGPRYNRRRGSGNIAAAGNINTRSGRTGSGAIYADVDFNWYGDRVSNAVDEALINAMDRILDEAVKRAVPLAREKSGDLKRSIMKLQITLNGDLIHGEFGSGMHYALYQELGTSKISGTFYLSTAGIQVAQMFTQYVQFELRKAGY